MSPAPTYAKVGGPPDDWQDIYVIDVDTGRIVPDVVEVNTEEGWAIRCARDEDGQFVGAYAGVKTVTEHGNYRLEHRRAARSTV